MGGRQEKGYVDHNIWLLSNGLASIFCHWDIFSQLDSRKYIVAFYGEVLKIKVRNFCFEFMPSQCIILDIIPCKRMNSTNVEKFLYLLYDVV